MPEENMTAERQPATTTDIAGQNQPTQIDNPQRSQPRLSPDQLVREYGPHSFIDVRALISPSEIRRRREERANSAEDLFGENVERLTRLEAIQTELSSTALNGESRNQNYPIDEELLSSYSTFSEKEKKRLKEAVRLLTEKRIRITLDSLTSDIRTLHQDRGETEQKASGETERFTRPELKGKKRNFGNLGRNEQMGVIGKALDLRNRLLRDNMEHYFYYLSAYQDAANLSDDQLNQKREEFHSSTEEQQTVLASETRRTVNRVMSATFEANLQRLYEFETMEGKPQASAEKEASDLRLSYEKGSLSYKDRINERVIKRKENLALPHLQEIMRLRQIIQRGERHDMAEAEEFEENEDPRLVLRDEVDWIDELLVTKLSSGFGQFGYNPGGTIEDMRNIVAGLAQAYEDPSLVQTFQRVRLLRTVPGESFYL